MARSSKEGGNLGVKEFLSPREKALGQERIFLIEATAPR